MKVQLDMITLRRSVTLISKFKVLHSPRLKPDQTLLDHGAGHLDAEEALSDVLEGKFLQTDGEIRAEATGKGARIVRNEARGVDVGAATNRN